MAEYVERDWLYEQMNATGAEFSLCDALEMIENFPAADVAPVRHGRWEAIKSNGIGGTGRCSCCEKAIYGYRAYNYCPNCGAKMDGGFDNG